MKKTTVFNLIILDESGSMSPVTRQTVDGCNETLNLIRSLEAAHSDTQRNLVSIYLFQTNAQVPSRYVAKNKPIAEVDNMTDQVYKPWGGTPLLDAVGATLVDLEAVASTHEDATGTVTIITDGEENSSIRYSWEQVSGIISRMKEMGWTFNFIGANIDVKRVSSRMNIDNSMAFTNDVDGTRAMFARYNDCLRNYEESRIAEEEAMADEPQETRVNARKKRAFGFFK